MSKGLVYILTNPCLDGWVKIGMTERNDIEKRLQELNSPTNLPLSYRCYLHVNGWKFFTKAGVTLSDLRDQIESEQEEEE